MFKTSCALGAACAFLLAGFVVPAAAQQSSGKAAQGAQALSKSDQRFFQTLAQANLAEIQTGKLAQGKGASEEVRQFGQHMVDDHGKMLEQQRSMAKAKNVTLPAAPDDKHKQTLQRLEGLSGQAFDRAYSEEMVKGHESALELVKNIAGKADDPDLKAMGQKAVPEIQGHLEKAKRLASSAQPARAGSK